jgi:hypothetical protein
MPRRSARRFYQAASGLFVPAPSLSSNVTVNATGTKGYQGSNTTSYNYTGLTINAGSNTVLVVSIAWDTGVLTPPTNLAMTWDGVACERILKSGTDGRAELWGLVNPATGNKTLALTWTGNCRVFVGAMAFDNANQGGKGASFPGASLVYGAGSATIPVVSAANAKVMSVGVCNAIGTPTGTTVFTDGASGSAINTFVNYDDGAAPTKAIGSSVAPVVLAATDIRSVSDTITGLTVNANGVSKFQANGASFSGSGLINVKAGTHTALLVVVTRADGANSNLDAGVTVTWDAGGSNQTMTLIASKYVTVSHTKDRVAQIWGLRAPTVGDKTLSITWTNAAADNLIQAVAFDGVEQASDGAAFPHSNNGASVTTIAVTSAVGNFVVGAICDSNGVDIPLPTSIGYDVVSNTVANSGAQYIVGAASTTVGMTAAVAQAICGVDVQAG